VLLDALTGHDLKAESSRIRLIEIGEMAGPTLLLPAAALRSSGIEIYGSGGGGSIPPNAILETFPQLWALAAEGPCASRPSRFLSPTWRARGNGKACRAAESLLSRSQLTSNTILPFHVIISESGRGETGHSVSGPTRHCT
jgi:hypothetical protein